MQHVEVKELLQLPKTRNNDNGHISRNMDEKGLALVVMRQRWVKAINHEIVVADDVSGLRDTPTNLFLISLDKSKLKSDDIFIRHPVSGWQLTFSRKRNENKKIALSFNNKNT